MRSADPPSILLEGAQALGALAEFVTAAAQGLFADQQL